jgi:uncharacterized repeat protein (TIGR01451 family)
MKKQLLLLLLTAFSFVVNAQNATVSYNSTAQPDAAFTVCGAAQTNSLKISNGNGTAMTGTVLTLHIPSGGTYVAGSITGATENNISNLNAPVFNVPTIPASNNTTITYQIMYGCGVIAYQAGGGLTKETFDVTYNGSTTQTGITTPSTYNVVAAALSLTALSPIGNTMNVGDTYTQTATMVNGGLGCTTSAYLVLGGGSNYTYTAASSGTISHDTIFFAAVDMPSGDGSWCNGESKTVTYTVQLNNCNLLNPATYIGWGCGGANCQTSTSISTSIIVNNSTPNLSITMPNPDDSYCFIGEQKMQTIRIVNTGAGPATNIKLSLDQGYPGSYGGYNYYDTTTAWVVKNKTGVIIGILSNYNVTGQTSISLSNCTNANRFNSLNVNLNTTILAGDTIYIDLWTIARNFNCNTAAACGQVTFGWAAIRGQLDYKNQCGLGAYSTGYQALLNKPYHQLSATTTMLTDITGGTAFNLPIDFTAIPRHATAGGLTYYTIAGFTSSGLSTTATSITVGSTVVSVNVINDTLWIGPFPENVTTSGSVNLPIMPVCGSEGLKTIAIQYMFKYNNCAAANFLKGQCLTANFTLHCPSTPCPKGGATPTNFTLARISYGLPDNDNNRYADASGVIDVTKINTHRSINGDTLQATWNIKVNPNNDPTDAHFGQTFTNTYLDFSYTYSSGTNNNDTLVPLPNAQVTIYPAGGGAAINCTVSPTIGSHIAHYDFNACHSPWANGDSMVVTALYKVYNAFQTTHTDIVTSNQVYSTYAPQTTPTTAPISNTTYTCTHYNDYHTFVHIWGDAYEPAPQTISGCTNSLVTYYRQGLDFYGSLGGNVFPYEFRNWATATTYAVQIPHGFSLRPNTATFAGVVIPAANIMQVGDTLFFTNLQNLYTTYGGTLVPYDESLTMALNFQLDAGCDAASGTYKANSKWTAIGNGANVPVNENGTIFWGQAANNYWSYGTGQTNGYIYNAPQPSFAGGGLITTNTGSASYTLQLQNLSNSVASPNSYFYISPLNHFTNIVIKEGAIVITPDANGFYQLGSLAASANRNFTVTADLGICSLDSMRMYFGYACLGYPTTFTAQPCQQFAWLKAQGFPAALDITFDRVPSAGTVGLCTPFTLEAVINSNLVGNLDNEVYKVVLPPNVSYVAGSVQVLYPVVGAYTASAYNPTVSPAATGDTLIFLVNSVTGGVGLTGVGDLTKNQVKIKFDAQTTCGYISGSSVKAIVTGTSVCGDPTATVVKTTNGINLTGANATTQYQIIESGANTISTCGTAQTYTFTVINTGSTAPPANDSVTINLSNGLALVSGSVVGIHNGPSPANPVVNGNLLRWRIPATVLPGDSMKFTINLTANSAGCGPNTMDLFATQSIALSCGGNSCSTPVITGRLITDTITTICCVDMQVTKTVSPSPVTAGATAVYTIAVKNNGPGTATNIVVNDVLPAGVTYVSNTTTHGTYTAPDWSIASLVSGASDTLKITVTAPNATTSPIIVSNTAYVKSIDNTTPETNRTNDTSRVSLTISANCSSFAPSLTSNSPICQGTNLVITVGGGDQYSWSGPNLSNGTIAFPSVAPWVQTFNNAQPSQSGNYTFNIHSGSCLKDTTINVVIKATSASTTNTSICNGDSTLFNGVYYKTAGSFVAHLTNAVGCDSAATLVLTVNALPNAGAAQTVSCNVTGIATMAAVGTGTWSAVAGNPGTATITTPTSATSTITNFSVAGIYSFKWTNAAGCSSTTTVAVGSNCCRAGNVAPTLKP